MKKIRDGYKNSFRSFSMKYFYYPYDSVNKAIDSLHGVCSLSGNSYYYKVGNSTSTYEYIKNDKYYVIIDHPNKAVALNYSAKASPDLWNITRIDSMLNTNTGYKITYKELENGKAEYSVICPGEGMWNRVRIVFDKTTFTLWEVWLYSSDKGKLLGKPYDKPKVGIIYSAYTSKPEPDASIFSENKFIEVTGSEAVLIGDYKKFRLLNYLKPPQKSKTAKKQNG